ncbi:hydrogenase maturation protease [Alteribacter natronophilus]|uniref:hydrogenase maturation protease n=1 Tax=Alteribacter natronophilus TaxID=2583810 RepID=UPI00110D427F|nr:hydrogenase maturation protease [Alteribacter natronophilus]TMW71425.1 hydrogenase maturation protease [Alteribacter natronophilus]
MKDIVVIGIGSRLMKDDAIGLFVVEGLRERGRLPGLRYVIGETDIDFCLGEVDQADGIVVVDAMLCGGLPGEVTCWNLEELNSDKTIPVSPHNIHLFSYLFQDPLAGKTKVIGIEPAEVAVHWGLSTKLERMRAQITDETEEILRIICKNLK